MIDKLSPGDFEALVAKYSSRIPRYTSYPTAVEFSSDFGPEQWLAALSNEKSENSEEQAPGYSLYFHLPFCKTLCYFCACNKIIPKNRDLVEPYISALIKEMKTYRALLGDNIQIEQSHWGGGTPNFLTANEMEWLFNATKEIFPNFEPDADISIEIDPRTSEVSQIETLARLGFNRASFGVQDFNPDVQNTVNRIQPFEMTRDVCQMARDNGFSSINIDLIYGLPNQTVDGFSSTVDKILELRPERIALYGYAHVTWIKKVQKALERAHLPTPSERLKIFMEALTKFNDAGYEYIGMDHFALPEDPLAKALKSKRLNRNFMGYTTHSGVRVLGFGASAISSLRTCYAQNTKEVPEYIELISESGIATVKGLTKNKDDLMREEIIQSLLCQGELEVEAFEGSWGNEFKELMLEQRESLKSFENDSLLSCDEKKIQLSNSGRLFSRNVASVFDAYLAKHAESSAKVFSKSV